MVAPFCRCSLRATATVTAWSEPPLAALAGHNAQPWTSYGQQGQPYGRPGPPPQPYSRPPPYMVRLCRLQCNMSGTALQAHCLTCLAAPVLEFKTGINLQAQQPPGPPLTPYPFPHAAAAAAGSAAQACSRPQQVCPPAVSFLDERSTLLLHPQTKWMRYLQAQNGAPQSTLPGAHGVGWDGALAPAPSAALPAASAQPQAPPAPLQGERCAMLAGRLSTACRVLLKQPFLLCRSWTSHVRWPQLAAATRAGGRGARPGRGVQGLAGRHQPASWCTSLSRAWM